MTGNPPFAAVSREEGGTARVALDRPAVRNAFDDAAIAELDRLFAALDGDDSVRAVLLRGNGPAFSAGADLNWMKRMAGYDRAANLADAQALGAMMRRLAALSKPVVGLVHGAAFGGGAGLVACCDIAIAAADAVFSFSEVRLGLIPAVIAPHVVAAIGPRQARRWFVTGERFDAAEARRIGLVHEVVAREALDEAGARVLAGLAANGPRAMAAAKELVAAVAGRPLDAALVDDTARRIADSRAGAEGREGIAAFLEKRPPGWAAAGDRGGPACSSAS